MNPTGAKRGKRVRARGWLGLLLGLAAMLAEPASSAEIVVGSPAGKPGESVSVPVYARGVKNLAGVKLVLIYDADRLTFEQADKTPLTTSLMHIVNSKEAGRLIVVMAGARGVNAEDGTILDLRFRVPEGETKPGTAAIELRQVQVMSDQLKEVAATRVPGGVRLGGETPESVPEAVNGAKPETAERGAPTEPPDEPAEKSASMAETTSPPSPPTAESQLEEDAETGTTPKADEKPEECAPPPAPKSAPPEPEASSAE
ncbi:MAG: cohesin domain-containing protein [Desulfococcaceae bacterium]